MKLTLAVLALLVGLSLSAGGARAHAVLVEATPADGAVLAAPPPTLRLAFNESVRLVFLRLLDSAGRQLLADDAGRSADGVVEAAAPLLVDGLYVLTWRVASADGHPIGGSAVFRVGPAEAPAAVALPAEGAEGRWRLVSATLRGVVYAAVLLAAGGAAFIALIAGGLHADVGAVRRYVSWSAAVGAAALLAGIGAEGALLTLPDSWVGLVDAGTWAAGAAGGEGWSAALSLAGLAAIAAGLAVRARWVLLAGALLAIAGFAATGHAATAGPLWLSRPLVALHAAAAAVWIGALWPLLRVVQTAAAVEAARVLRRFSDLAVTAVAILVVAGVLLSALQVRRPEAFVSTSYGLVLLAKLALVGGLLACAAVNRWRLAPALARAPVRAARGLRRSIAAELVLAAGVLAATAALGTIPPPRALMASGGHDHHGQPASRRVVAATGPYQAEIELAPGRAGFNVLIATLSRGGAALEPLGVEAAFANRAAGIEPIVRSLAPAGPGVWRLDDATLPVGGEWTVRIVALVSDFEQAVFEAGLPVR